MRVAADPGALTNAARNMEHTGRSAVAHIPTTVTAGGGPSVAEAANAVAGDWGEAVGRRSRAAGKTTAGLV
jgi:hypothetical protein